MNPRRTLKAISVVISTLILSASILTITLVALFVSNSVLEQQLDISEFEQAKNSVLTLVDIIEHVAVSPGSAGYVQMNLRTAHPNFVNGLGPITVTVSSISSPILDGKTGSLEVGGGRYVGVGSGIEVLVGRDDLIVENAYDPLGYVYVIQQNGAWIIMNHARVRVSDMGVFAFHEGDEIVERNVVRVSFINMTFGTIRVFGTGTLNLVARSNRTIVEPYRITGTELSVTVDFTGRPSESFTIQLPSGVGETIVYVVRVDVEISSL